MDYIRYFEMPLAFVQTFSKWIPKLICWTGWGPGFSSEMAIMLPQQPPDLLQQRLACSMQPHSWKSIFFNRLFLSLKEPAQGFISADSRTHSPRVLLPKIPSPWVALCDWPGVVEWRAAAHCRPKALFWLHGRTSTSGRRWFSRLLMHIQMQSMMLKGKNVMAKDKTAVRGNNMSHTREQRSYLQSILCSCLNA